MATPMQRTHSIVHVHTNVPSTKECEWKLEKQYKCQVQYVATLLSSALESCCEFDSENPILEKKV